MRVAIVENTAATNHGQIGVALHEAGARIDLYKPWKGQPLPTKVDADALVVFGGEQSALDDHSHPYLPQLAQLMAEYTALDRPVLGICLGCQLLARAFGAENHLGRTPEFGWTPITLTEAGRADPVLGHLPTTFPIYQWHGDTFTLPKEAVQLASSAAVAQQGFRIGRATYGTQFHFEANRAVVRDWRASFPDLMNAARPNWDFETEAASLGAEADAHGLSIARAWVRLI
ncbi:type 1 glutamine amidotransferase [Xinfangfangia sp. CPCC 101601]|uniref:Type 1 glutamine amidotransferase n=1 Tax=Pseudogemmobacter lacusdianii TaxID=3069608 RepID=A0ABU0VV82_9RHOB|nr:type 1 glutamine amidotransferase [Xinfangfangia sp. CPCC 101601]MDQ2065558.1 type 1 glutamine amidotransferase [Xinfangfangia sp. CPCC 101601]